MNRALLAALLVAAAAGPAAAERCTGITDGGERFPTCFDVGNRLFVSGGTGGFGGGVLLRHAMTFADEPDLTWKLEHRLLEGSALGMDREIEASLYRGRYLRHARDGHLVLPFGLPKKIFLPFDIGAEAAVGGVDREAGSDAVDLEVVRVAGLLDWIRTPSFGRRLAIGVLARWDMGLDTSGDELAIVEHRVMPLTGVTATAGFETASGLTSGALSFEGGRAWSTETGWAWNMRAAVEAERTLVALNDRPLSIQLEASARLPGGDGDSELRIGVNARFALLAKTSRGR